MIIPKSWVILKSTQHFAIFVVIHGVIDDPMRLRMEAGSDGLKIRECFCWEAWLHVWHSHAIGSKLLQMWSKIHPVNIIVSESVVGND